MVLAAPGSPQPVRPRPSAWCQARRQQGTVLGVAGDPGGSHTNQLPPTPATAARTPCLPLTIQRLGARPRVPPRLS